MPLDDNDKQWIIEQLERVETKLLTAFHRWASPADIRLRSHRESLHALEIDMDSLKERVTALEESEHGQA